MYGAAIPPILAVIENVPIAVFLKKSNHIRRWEETLATPGIRVCTVCENPIIWSHPLPVRGGEGVAGVIRIFSFLLFKILISNRSIFCNQRLSKTRLS